MGKITNKEIKSDNKNISFSKEVLEIQKKLNKINYCKLEEDGLLNDETKKNIFSFRKTMGLKNGLIDNNIKFILNEILTWDKKDKTRTFAVKYNQLRK